MLISNIIVRFVSVVLAVGTMVGCQNDIDNKQYLNIKFIGVLTAPEEATGDNDPISQDYTIEGIYLSPDPDSGDALSLYSDDPTEFRIIERSQIVYKREIDATWVGEKFDSLVIRLNSTVNGLSKFADDHVINLSADATTDIGYYTEFSVEKGQGIDAVVQVQWKNTVMVDPADEANYLMSIPTFDVSISLN